MFFTSPPPVNELRDEAGAFRPQYIAEAFSQWDGSHKRLTQRIKSTMNNPGSYEHIDTEYSDQGEFLIVRTKFRGTNAFGGKIMNCATAKVGVGGNVLRVISQGLC